MNKRENENIFSQYLKIIQESRGRNLNYLNEADESTLSGTASGVPQSDPKTPEEAAKRVVDMRTPAVAEKDSPPIFVKTAEELIKIYNKEYATNRACNLFYLCHYIDIPKTGKTISPDAIKQIGDLLNTSTKIVVRRKYSDLEESLGNDIWSGEGDKKPDNFGAVEHSKATPVKAPVAEAVAPDPKVGSFEYSVLPFRDAFIYSLLLNGQKILSS